MGKMSREKGKRGEREVAKVLLEEGILARRGVQHAGGVDSPDVVHEIDGIHLEVKYTEKLSLWPALDQATEDAGDKKIPVVVHRKNRKPWVAILPLDRFLQMVKIVDKSGELW